MGEGDNNEYLLTVVFLMGALILGALALGFREMGLSETPGRIARWTIMSFVMAFIFMPPITEMIEQKWQAARQWRLF